MIKNNKGITLIALIVTIIVLIIIAGISIATLTSNNGVINQVNTAKVKQIEATAREQMDLACSAVRLAIAEASARDNSYRANKNSDKIQDVLLETVKKDSTVLESASWKEGTLDSTAGTFTITYEGDDYKNACNDDNAIITYTITLAQRSIEVTDVSTGIKGPNGSDINIDIGAESGNGGGSIPVTPPPSTTGTYLVDQVVIGDYVDIGISYTNPTAPTTSYLSGTNTAMTGWRVLSKNGSGASGTVTLVSAGAPLKLYHPGTSGSSDTSINTYLKNLNTTITVDVSSTHGYRANGFTGGNDLASIWSSKSAILDASSAHAMTTTELETAYKELTGTAYTMTSNSSNYLMRTSNMTFKDTVLAEKGKDLLGCGIAYWLGGSSYNADSLWCVGLSGGVYRSGYTYGVRVAVSLKSGVQISGDNTGTGADVSTAYKLAE